MSKNEQVRRVLNLLYHVAYAQGHHDTVEGCYTHVIPIDRHTYHDEAVGDLLQDEEFTLLKDMEAQEPVAWMYKGGDSRYPAYLTLEKDIAEEDADDPSSIIPLYAHPSPSAPVELSEEDIERMVDEERRIITPLSSAVTGEPSDDPEHEEASAESRETWIGALERAIRHIAERYTLHPKP